jgi:hypothetical protein
MPEEGLLKRNLAGRHLLDETADLLANCDFKLERTRIAVFVCGGSPKVKEGEIPSWRGAFLEWINAQGHASRLEIVLAEKAYDAAVKQESKFLNISDFETILADLSDCVLLFPESAGSYAEAGVFASNQKILTKVLVANEFNYHNSSSFLNLGPLHTLTSTSRFSQAIVLSGDVKLNNTAFSVIKDRIEENARRNRTAIKWTSSVDVNLREKSALILAIIRIAGLLSVDDLNHLLLKISLDIPLAELDQIVRILLMFKQIERQTDDVFKFVEASRFEAAIEGAKGKLTGLTASYREFYVRNFPRLLDSRKEVGAE